jgi:hypothetical protein
VLTWSVGSRLPSPSCGWWRSDGRWWRPPGPPSGCGSRGLGSRTPESSFLRPVCANNKSRCALLRNAVRHTDRIGSNLVVQCCLKKCDTKITVCVIGHSVNAFLRLRKTSATSHMKLVSRLTYNLPRLEISYQQLKKLPSMCRVARVLAVTTCKNGKS